MYILTLSGRLAISHNKPPNVPVVILYCARFVGVGARRVRSLFHAAKKKVNPQFSDKGDHRIIQLHFKFLN